MDINKKSTTHYLKTWNKYFQLVHDDLKHFEIRKNDRNFLVNDIVILEEYDPEFQKFTGRKIKAEICSIVTEYIGLSIDFCIFSIKIIEKVD